MKVDVYTKALIPNPYTIMGCRLLPFSLGHLTLMRRFDCKYGSDDLSVDELSVDDLLLGIQICSRTFNEFLEDIRTDEFAEWIHEWAVGVTSEKQTTEEVYNRMLLFGKYIKEHSWTPSYWNEKQGNENVSDDWMRGVINVLISECGYSRDEALNSSFSQSMTDYLTWCERQGSIKFYSSDEIEQMESLEEEEVKVNNNG